MRALIDLIICDKENPRSFAWVIHGLQKSLEKLNRLDQNKKILFDLTQFKFQAHQVDELSQLDKNNHLSNLALFIDDVYQSAIEVVEDINANYFNHIYRSDYRI